MAGLSFGFVVCDDTGSEWSRDGEKFDFHLLPNRFFHGKDSNRASAPYFRVALGPADREPPPAPAALAVDPADLPAGEAWVSWETPRDAGPAGTLGFAVQADGRDVPRHLIPLAGRPGAAVRMHLRDLGLAPAAKLKLAVRAVDAAGNLGPPAETTARVSGRRPAPLPEATTAPRAEPAPLPRLGAVEVSVIDELDKMDARGGVIPPQPDGYRSGNHLWSARDRTIRLQAARNEFVAFQLHIAGPVRGLRPTLRFEGAAGAKIRAEFGRPLNVATPAGPLPDPARTPADGLKNFDQDEPGSLFVEIYVPHDAKAGVQSGKLTLDTAGHSLALDVFLETWDFTLPDVLSFLPEMNCYGLPANERAFYRLAHRHRTYINRVPYSQNGQIAEGCAPAWDAKARVLDWSAWDRRFGPLLDGTAFADLPRNGVPIEGFYLPLHENWPTPIEGHYNGDYWADRAFDAEYRAAFVEVSRQFAEHMRTRGWSGTLFQGFLNNKVDFKRRGWSRGTSPWLLDEPASLQDFWALRYFAAAFHEGVKAGDPGRVKLVFRADISRPEWQRDTLDGLLDFAVVGGAMRRYGRIVADRKAAEGQIVLEYGGTNAVEASNVQAAAWCVDAWTLGADGVIPWQTIGRSESWTAADPLALFYPSREGPDVDPSPSLRLKAYRRGQQDVEYLTLLARATGEPRWAVAGRVREALRLEGRRVGTGFAGGEDAGQIRYDTLRPQDLWALRRRVGRALSETHPEPRRALVDWTTPRRDPSRLEGRMVRSDKSP